MLWLGGTGHPWSWVVLAVSLFAVFAYSVPGLRFKERPVLDSITSSTHFVSPAVYGLAVAGAVPTPQLVALLAAFFCWGMASHAFGAVQDVVPDREAGIASIATAFGARRDRADRPGALARRRPAHARDRVARPARRRCSSCRTSSPRGRTVR